MIKNAEKANDKTEICKVIECFVSGHTGYQRTSNTGQQRVYIME
jgi:hypothetical protein